MEKVFQVRLHHFAALLMVFLSFCSIQLAAPTVYVRGTDYLTWGSTRSYSTTTDQISFRFKTYLASGLLFTVGDRRDYLTIDLVDGTLTLNIDLGGGEIIGNFFTLFHFLQVGEFFLSPSAILFDSNYRGFYVVSLIFGDFSRIYTSIDSN